MSGRCHELLSDSWAMYRPLQCWYCSTFIRVWVNKHSIAFISWYTSVWYWCVPSNYCLLDVIKETTTETNLFHGHTTITKKGLVSAVSAHRDMLLLENKQLNNIINNTQALVKFSVFYLDEDSTCFIIFIIIFCWFPVCESPYECDFLSPPKVCKGSL